MKRAPFQPTGGWSHKPHRMPWLRWIKAWCEIDENRCWNWTRCLDKRGYGEVRVERHEAVHRLVKELTDGRILSCVKALHKCDNPRCCNPDHIYLGTQQDNLHDYYERTQPKAGTRHKLSHEQKREIRRRVLAGETSIALGKEFGVSSSAIRTWRRWRINA